MFCPVRSIKCDEYVNSICKVSGVNLKKELSAEDIREVERLCSVELINLNFSFIQNKRLIRSEED